MRAVTDILGLLWDAGAFRLLPEAVASGSGAAATERDARSACGEVTCSEPRADVVEAVPVGIVVWSVTRAVEAMGQSSIFTWGASRTEEGGARWAWIEAAMGSGTGCPGNRRSLRTH